MKNESNLFSLGQVLFSYSINETIAHNEAFAVLVSKSLMRHQSGDWGNLDHSDKEMNNNAIKLGNRIFSSYLVPEPITETMNDKIWIITEAKDHEGSRRSTTILFPSEY